MSKAMYALTFTIGTCVGGVVAWVCAKTKFNARLEVERLSFKEIIDRERKQKDITESEPSEPVVLDIDELEAEMEANDVTPVMPEDFDVPGDEDVPPYVVNEDEEEQAYVDLLDDLPYGVKDEDTKYTVKRKNSEFRSKHPYVIPPEDYGNKEYEEYELTYYADGILTDDMDRVVDNIEDTVGRESLNHIGDYAAGTVHVRNDRLECDYEITYDMRTYKDVIAAYPYKAGV